MTLHLRNLDPDLETRFRELILDKFGYRKGNISKAFTEALEYYVYNQEGFLEWSKFRKIMKKGNSII